MEILQDTEEYLTIAQAFNDMSIIYILIRKKIILRYHT